MKRLIILVVMLALAGCSTMSYTSKDGTVVTYKRVFAGTDPKVTVGDVVIEPQGQGLDIQSLLGALIKK